MVTQGTLRALLPFRAGALSVAHNGLIATHFPFLQLKIKFEILRGWSSRRKYGSAAIAGVIILS